MLPATYANLMSPMHATHAPRGVSAELAGHVRREYGATATYALVLLEGAKNARAARSRGASRGRFEAFAARLVDAVRAPFASARAAAGGA